MIVTPSLHTGYARSAAESEYPDLWRGLIGAWVPGIDSSPGNLLDLSQRAGIATIDGAVKESSRYGTALRFDGSNDYIALPSISALFTTDATLFLRLKLDVNTPADGLQTGITTIGTSASADHYPFTNGTIYSGVWRNDRITVGTSTQDRTSWHTVTIVNTPGTNGWKFWVGTTIVNQSTGESSVFVTASPQIAQGPGSQNLDGLISEIFILNRM